MATKAELQQRLVELEQAFEEARDLIDDTLGIDDDEDEDEK